MRAWVLKFFKFTINFRNCYSCQVTHPNPAWNIGVVTVSVIFSIVRLVCQCVQAGFSAFSFLSVAKFYCSELFATLSGNFTSIFSQIFKLRFFSLYRMSFKLSFCVGRYEKSFHFFIPTFPFTLLTVRVRISCRFRCFQLNDFLWECQFIQLCLPKLNLSEKLASNNISNCPNWLNFNNFSRCQQGSNSI